MIKKLFSFGERGDEHGAGPELAPHWEELELALVLVSATGDQQLAHTIGQVMASAEAHGGHVLQILGGLLLVHFPGEVEGAKAREAFVRTVCAEQRLFVRAVHGLSRALVGTFGTETRLAYTAIPQAFLMKMAELCRLSPGESAQWQEVTRA